MQAKNCNNKNKSTIFVSDHAVDKYLRFVKKKHNLSDNPRQELLKILNEAVEIDIPESCKVLSLLNNDFKEARYYYSSASSVLLVLNETRDVIITCYNYDPQNSKKELFKKARQTLRVERAKNKYQKTLEIKKDKSKYNEDRESYRREKRWR